MTWFFKDRLDEAMGNCWLANFNRDQYVARAKEMGARNVVVIEHPTNNKLFAVSCMHPADDSIVLLEGWFMVNAISV